MEEDEMLDLVDENDEVIGQVLRSKYDEIVIKQPGFKRAADAFLMNSAGKLWIPRRRAHKKIAPNGLDYSVGEHVQAGEDYITACIRGFAEELNLHIKPKDVKLLKKFAPQPEVSEYFQSLFLYRSDVSPDYNPDDFSEYFWLSPDELVAKLEAGELAKLSLLRAALFMQTVKLS